MVNGSKIRSIFIRASFFQKKIQKKVKKDKKGSSVVNKRGFIIVISRQSWSVVISRQSLSIVSAR